MRESSASGSSSARWKERAPHSSSWNHSSSIRCCKREWRKAGATEEHSSYSRNATPKTKGTMIPSGDSGGSCYHRTGDSIPFRSSCGAVIRIVGARDTATTH